MPTLKQTLQQQESQIKALEETVRNFESRFKQLFIFERILFGIIGDNKPFDYNGEWKRFKNVLHPFGGVPGPQAGATRMHRLHALYSDNMLPGGFTEVKFDMYQFGESRSYTFEGFDHTHGTPLENDQRLYFSKFLQVTNTQGHAEMSIRLTRGGNKGRLVYLGLQFWDFYA
jgi:hypothetical protein